MGCQEAQEPGLFICFIDYPAERKSPALHKKRSSSIDESFRWVRRYIVSSLVVAPVLAIAGANHHSEVLVPCNVCMLLVVRFTG